MNRFNFLILFCVSLASYAQDLTISGTVLDDNKQPVAYANVILYTSDESQIITGSSTNEEGEYNITNLKSGDYVLKLSYLGFESVSKIVSVTKTTNVGVTTLKTSAETLAEVTVNAKKPTINKLADRLVFNVENTALVEGSILDVVRSTPSVFILDEGIKVKNSYLTIYINDKKVNLSGEEVIQLLESSPANSIKSIELITTPGARYEASSGVVLNIIMSKNLIIGYRGRVFSKYKQGVFPNYEAGISNFYKTDKISLSANYSFSKDKLNRENKDQINYLNNDNALEQLWASNVNRNKRIETHNANINFDYYINDNNTFSLSSRIVLTPSFDYAINNRTLISDDNNNLLSSFNANTLSTYDKDNLGFDADYVSKFKDDSKLSVNANYTTFDYFRVQNINSDYFLADDTFDYDTAFKTNSNQDINIVSSQADYYIPFNDDSSLSLGIKGGFVKTNNDVVRYSIEGSQEVIDSANSNIFDYDENVLAAYVDYKDQFGDFIFNGGLRAEQTNVNGKSLNSNNKQNYLNWFPTVVLTHKTTEKLSLYTKYKRTISRPDYQSLNPFEFLLNDNIIVSGNPNLQPAFTNRWELGTILNDTHTFEVSLITSKGNFNELGFQDNDTNIITYTPQNIGNTTELNFIYETYFTAFDKLSIYFVTAMYYSKEETKVENVNVALDQWSNYTAFDTSISFLKDNSLSTNLSMTYLSKRLSGLQTIKGMLISELAISKTIWNKKGTISLIASDLFNKADFKTSTNYLNQSFSQFTNLDNRYVKLGFSYKFGNSTLKTNEKDRSHSERSRINSGD